MNIYKPPLILGILGFFSFPKRSITGAVFDRKKVESTGYPEQNM